MIAQWLTVILFLFVSTSDLWAQWTPITPSITPIKAAHISELRTQIDSKLVMCGQPVYVWAEPIVAGTTLIKKSHLDELRAATTGLVNADRVQKALPALPPTYVEAINVGVTPIKAAHLTELRGYVDGATCVVPGCPAQNLTWTATGNTCTGTFPLTASSATAVGSSFTAGLSGTAAFKCVAGAWAVTPNPGATCTPAGCEWNAIAYLGSVAPQDAQCTGSPGPTGDGTPTGPCGLPQSGNLIKCCDSGADCFRYRCECI